MTLAGGLVIVFALTQQIGADPWWSPRFALPLFGMILGNTMTGVSLGLDTLSTGLWRESAAVEARLLLGATRWEAVRPFARRAMRSGMTPIINAMAATGVISLPGMMTGQILSGVDPAEAVKYQLLIIFLIAGATGLGVVMAIAGGIWRLTDERHRLRLDRLAGERG
jgi:putative ABC transport system permease protein